MGFRINKQASQAYIYKANQYNVWNGLCVNIVTNVLEHFSKYCGTDDTAIMNILYYISQCSRSNIYHLSHYIRTDKNAEIIYSNINNCYCIATCTEIIATN